MKFTYSYSPQIWTFPFPQPHFISLMNTKLRQCFDKHFGVDAIRIVFVAKHVSNGPVLAATLEDCDDKRLQREILLFAHHIESYLLVGVMDSLDWDKDLTEEEVWEKSNAMADFLRTEEYPDPQDIGQSHNWIRERPVF